ncbi:MAG: hypothetical protein H8E89_08900 [Candidatus Nitrosopelagicus sp.]|nr:hypothetical protein [Candidatus Nitrosopelagicus sp.]
MNEKELQRIVRENGSNFKMIVGLLPSIPIDKIEMFQTDNPIKEPTTRGGIYFAEMKEWKVHATFLDTGVSKHLSNAMLGPNKDFLDIILQVKLKDGHYISLVTNLTNSMQDASKLVLYLTLINAKVEL